jgi:hypothetical protein
VKTWLDNLTGRLLIVARTQVQLDTFCRSHQIPKNRVCRIRTSNDLRGRNVDRLLILLPDSIRDRETRDLVTMWFYRGGNFIHVSEAIVLGEKPLCPNDIDGDGDCHLCAKLGGGCIWPNYPISFAQQYMGHFVDDQNREELYRLADQYLSETETYDRTVCTGPIERLGIRPANGDEYVLVSRDARRVYDTLMKTVKALGYTSRDFLNAIHDQERQLK